MILILTNAVDAHADYISRKLTERGADYLRVDNGDFPAQAELSTTFSPAGQPSYRLYRGAETYDLSQITAGWYRRPLSPVPELQFEGQPLWDYVQEETRWLVEGVWHALDCQWLPATRDTLLRAEDKVGQLRLAGALGFELPPTLIGNSPRALLEFRRQHAGEIICKSVHNPLLFDSEWKDSGHTVKTWLVSNRDWGYAASLRYCPAIFQAYVPKRLELRITVVGERVFACEIHSQQAHRTRHDWRNYDLANTPHRPHRLPLEIERLCVQLTARLGLCYGAIDLILTPDGRYVFLEINPNGQFAWIEDLTGLPISAAICDLLMAAEKRATSRPTLEQAVPEMAGRAHG